MTGRRYYLTTLAAWQRHAPRCAESHFVVADSSAAEEGKGMPILALITADEAAHIALENDAEFEVLPHPLARTPVSERVASALAQFGVASGDDTFTLAEKLARVNPLLRHRVF
ncbi:MAG TPA: hypothetical protein VGR81_00370 [Candidatus Acidoferrales bacterium]|nr:hypothetical protein [Candidatus Acidoferrales bacterium]